MKLFGEKPQHLGTIHFIGAGGIGMSGLMTLLHQAGFKVQGSDIAENGNVVRLRKLGISVHIGHATEHMAEVTRVVRSSAIGAENPEFKEAEARGIPVYHRADVLAEFMLNYPSIAVAGTHGKTSTTALIWAALKAAGIDAGIINGGILQSLQDTVQLPQTPEGWLVVEADESDRSFLKLPHTLAVVLNVEPEHMENYDHDEKRLYADFETFLAASSRPGWNILYGKGLPEKWYEDVVTYGSDGSDHPCTDVVRDGWQTHFSVPSLGVERATVNLPGAHYAENATAALAVVDTIGGTVEKALDGLADFEGVGRRFTNVGTFHGAVVVDDYGHHPTEIKATLKAARALTKGKLIAVVQPHRYSRLHDLMDRFATSTQEADVTFVLPVYAAGEDPMPGVTSEALVAKMKEGTFVADEVALGEQLSKIAGEGDTILMLGAGSISGMAQRLGMAHAA